MNSKNRITPHFEGKPAPAHASSPRLVVIAASAGGLAPILKILAPLPASFPAAIALVQHRGATQPERLIEILAKATALRVCHAQDGELLEAGTVYVCPPGLHMATEHRARLIEGPKLRFVQPSADLMFESVALAYGERAIGVVLSGSGSDAALGSLAIAQAGGVVLAQDDRTCEFADMPTAALRTGAVEMVLTPAEIAHTLAAMVEGRMPAPQSSVTSPGRHAGRVTRVLLADDHRIVIEGLAVLLDAESDMQVVERVADGAAAVAKTIELEPDVVVMDVRMPGVDGVDATRQLLARLPSTKVVALSAETTLPAIDALFRAGATGYLTKTRAFAELVQAIRTVMLGKVYLSPEVARLVARGAVAPPRQVSGRVS